MKKTIEENQNQEDLLDALERAMLEAAKNLEFEKAAYLRDRVREVKQGKKLSPEELPELQLTPDIANSDPQPEKDHIPQSYNEMQLLGTPKRERRPRKSSSDPKNRVGRTRRKKFL